MSDHKIINNYNSKYMTFGLVLSTKSGLKQKLQSVYPDYKAF